MRRRSLKKIILFWILPVIALSAFLTFFRPFWYIGFVKETVWENGVLYGVDEWNGKLRLFGCDAKGHNTWMDEIYSKEKNSDAFYTVADLEIMDDDICAILLQPLEVTDINNFLYLQYDLEEKQIIYSETLGNDQPADVYKRMERTNGIWTIQTDGSVWLSTADEEKLIFANDGTKISVNNTVYTFGNDGLYLYNADADSCYMIDYTNGSLSEAQDIPFQNAISSYGMLYSLNQMKDGTWTATFCTDYGQLCPMVVGESSSPLLRLSSPLHQAMKTFCITSAEILIGIFLLKLIVNRIRRTFPTALKIICFSIPLLAICCLGFQIFLQSFLKDDVMSRLYTQMYYTANILEKQSGLSSGSSNGENVNSHNILYAENILGGIYDSDGKILYNAEEIVGQVSVFGYKNGAFYDLDPGTLSWQSSAIYDYPEEELLLQDIVETKTTTKGMQYFYNTGLCLTMYYPVMDGQNVTGVIRVLYPEIDVTMEIMDQLVDLVKNIFIFLLMMMVFLTIICFLLLRPLNKIKHALSDISVGIDLEEPPKEGLQTEIKEMTNLFYHMSANIRDHLRHIDQLERAYEPYIPQKLIALFGKKDIREISPSDETVIEDAAILIMDSHGFAKAVSKAGTAEMFQFVNCVLQVLTESVENANGIVIQFTDTGLYACFESNPDQALQAALSAQEGLRSLSLTLAGEQLYFGMAIVCGNMRIGIIGDEERMEIRAVSQELKAAYSLQNLSSMFHLGILIDEETLERLDISAEVIRRFGFINDIDQPIYEVFSGLKLEEVTLKQITKHDFESGVEYFQKGDYRKAKECFIRVLRKNKDDLAAGRYLTLCGNVSESKEKGRNVFE